MTNRRNKKRYVPQEVRRVVKSRSVWWREYDNLHRERVPFTHKNVSYTASTRIPIWRSWMWQND